MKIFLFLLFCLFIFDGFCQFNPAEDWFTLEDFFQTKKIKAHSINRIKVLKSHKKDDETFNVERMLAEYSFSEEGKLLKSQSFVPLSRRIDTVSYEFIYEGERLASRRENEGVFSFKYDYLWEGDSAYVEIKVDQNTLDTNYMHRVEIYHESETSRKITQYSSIGRPMKSNWVSTDLFNQIIYKKESYTRSLSFVEEHFEYQATQLISKSKWNTIGRQKKNNWKYTYKNGYLDFIEYSENDQLIAKYALLYNERNLVNAIVKRDLIEKSISIFKVSYEFYPIEK